MATILVGLLTSFCAVIAKTYRISDSKSEVDYWDNTNTISYPSEFDLLMRRKRWKQTYFKTFEWQYQVPHLYCTLWLNFRNTAKSWMNLLFKKSHIKIQSTHTSNTQLTNQSSKLWQCHTACCTVGRHYEIECKCLGCNYLNRNLQSVVPSKASSKYHHRQHTLLCLVPPS